MIDIAMLSCNRMRITEISIRELASRTLTPYRLLVLDNGSVDGSQDMLSDLYDEGLIHYLQLDQENTGVHWGHNELLEAVKSAPFYICTDGDIVPQFPVKGVDWLELLVRLAKRNPDYGAISLRPHVMIGEPLDRFDGSPEIREMSHTGAWLRLMEPAVVREVGGWKKEKKPSRNNEDWYICGKLKKAGYKVGIARDIRAIHQFGKEEVGEDPWGYPRGVKHGHRPVWPPVNHSAWDRLGIDWETCR